MTQLTDLQKQILQNIITKTKEGVDQQSDNFMLVRNISLLEGATTMEDLQKIVGRSDRMNSEAERDSIKKLKERLTNELGVVPPSLRTTQSRLGSEKPTDTSQLTVNTSLASVQESMELQEPPVISQSFAAQPMLQQQNAASLQQMPAPVQPPVSQQIYYPIAQEPIFSQQPRYMLPNYYQVQFENKNRPQRVQASDILGRLQHAFDQRIETTDTLYRRLLQRLGHVKSTFMAKEREVADQFQLLSQIQNNPVFAQNISNTSDQLVKLVDYCNEQFGEIKKLDCYRQIRGQVEKFRVQITQYTAQINGQIHILRSKLEEMKEQRRSREQRIRWLESQFMTLSGGF